MQDRLEKLPADKRALLLEWLGEQDDELPGYALSPRQRGLWFLDRHAGPSALYNVPWQCRVHGVVDAATLRRALDAVVARHEPLRTRIRDRDGVPVQEVLPDARTTWHYTDLSELPAEQREPSAREIAQRVATEPFDLEQGPLMRVELIRLAADEFTVVFNVHHIVFDGWSMQVLNGELWDAYGDLDAGRTAPRPALPVSYGEHAERLAQQWTDGGLDAHLEHWSRYLSGAPAVLDLPSDRARPAVVDHTGGSVDVPVDEELIAAAHALGRGEHTTLFMTMFAAFTALMHRYSGQDDLTVGVPIAGRTGADTQDAIGLFVNVLPIRTKLTGATTFRELLRRVRNDMLTSFAHQDVPTDLIVDRMRVERDRSHSPLFQHLFAVAEGPATQRVAGLTVDPLEEIWTATAKFDLNWAVWVDGARSRISVEYATALFDEATVVGLAEHMMRLLRSAIADPDTRIEDLGMLGTDERDRIVRRWNDTARPFPDDTTLHRLIEQQVRRSPDADAVTFEDRTLTYAQLNAGADRLARRLRAAGVGPEDRVAVCAERSVELVVALLGVLKAGAAYLPLDPAYPVERLIFMLDDSAAPVLLTQRHLRDLLPPGDRLVIDLDEGCDDGDDSGVDVAVAPGNAAYVIYTSGSTGRPKGVTNTHRGICNRLDWMQREYRLGGDDVVLQKTPAGFDVSVWEFFWPLLTGARLVLARPGGHKDPAYLRDLIISAGVTTVHFVPSMLAAFLAVDDTERCVSLRRTICSGEELPRHLADLAARRLPGGLHNLYGPTEAAIDVTYWDCADLGDEHTAVPIGRPIQNTSLYVLSPALQPQPAGVPGELYLAGANLARGYLNRPGLTADRFLPDPFGPPGSRMYRTGDLVRFRRDGAVEFLGRLDGQVKIRGLRIELGEIEHALRRQPGIGDVAVVVREDHPGDKRIVAYPVAAPDLDPAPLRAALLRQLPDYMVPAAFVPVDRLPLSANGKLDRAALPAPGAATPSAKAAVAPRTPQESALVSIWEGVLGRAPVGVHDDFFDLGGNSLDVLRLTAQVQNALGVTLAPGDVFEHPTVEQLARRIAADAPATAGGPLRLLSDGGDGEPLILVHATGGTLACYATLVRRMAGERPVYGLTAPGAETAEEPVRDVGELARRYRTALTEAGLTGPVRLGGWSFGGVVAFEMARQMEAESDRRPPVVMLDSRAPDPVPTGSFDRVDLLALYAAELGRTAGTDLGIEAADLRELTGDQATELLLARARAHGLLDAGDGAEHLLRAGTVMAANVTAMAAYDPARPYGGPVTLLRAAEGELAPDTTAAWRRLVTGTLDELEVPGDHYSCLRPPQVDDTAKTVRQALTGR
ncbi:hypothetical protein ACTI_45440 [Actinoplanes sp. OR16]|uniref:non-ribosomal peptide synthetase n=1 Tax=Actinoplanes sp. OR16 TaxID=946334 RepID=UPI000F6D15F4|nr:non-ribosomal peptide synthetase [Actinoplanes sp. OR16]BBH67859.1 hypothetical protein ACTI_45440 [Actinoplanes sp. OR16]